MNILMTLMIAILGWKIAEKWKLPAPAMLGSMIAVGLSNIAFDYATLPMSVKIFAQSISGAFIGMQIMKKDLLNFKKLVKPFLLLMIILTANTFLMGVLLHRCCGLDITTALLSCVAGGVTDISIIAMEMNADAGTVALMQTSRLIGVLLFFPYWIKFLCRHESDRLQDSDLRQQINQNKTFLDRWMNTRNKKIIFTLIISVAFGIIGNASKIPAATMVFPMFAVVFFNCTTSACFVPLQIKNIAQLLAGALVGTSIRAATFSNLSTTLIPVLLLLISYWSVNLVYSLLCKKLNWLDLKSAMFASAPGGATDMSLIAADLGADLTKIALIQVLRAAYVVVAMPPLILLFVRWFQ